MVDAGRIMYGTIMETQILNKVRNLRAIRIPNELNVGSCINICLALGYLLQKDNHTVILVHGLCGDCYHTWFNVDGVDIDPGRDCVMIPNNKPWVDLTTPDKYKIHSTEVLEIENYFNLDKVDDFLSSILTGAACAN